LGGGARAAQQYLAGGHVDRMDLHVVPVLLGSGERMFNDVGDNMHGLRLVQTVVAPGVVHLRFAR
jgi:dihydrofolate reductase